MHLSIVLLVGDDKARAVGVDFWCKAWRCYRPRELRLAQTCISVADGIFSAVRQALHHDSPLAPKLLHRRHNESILLRRPRALRCGLQGLRVRRQPVVAVADRLLAPPWHPLRDETPSLAHRFDALKNQSIFVVAPLETLILCISAVTRTLIDRTGIDHLLVGCRLLILGFKVHFLLALLLPFQILLLKPAPAVADSSMCTTWKQLRNASPLVATILDRSAHKSIFVWAPADAHTACASAHGWDE
mmetsp:Transcript_3811/g.8256  ORF Transcript_3811/g.8256 Transcript_3811/m.8256 type:complete len:245 (-) Transcript_3811:672-1406(-)